LSQAFFVAAVPCWKQKKTNYPDGVVVDQPYEKVWGAVHELIFTDLGCVEKRSIKRRAP